MKTPICDICLKSGILCPACRENVNDGVVSESDVDSLVKMKGVSEKIKTLQGIHIKRLMNVDDVMIIVCKRGDATRIIGRGGTIVKNLAGVLGKKVRVVEETDDPKIFLEMLVFPASVVSLGRVYRRSGDMMRMRVPAGTRLPIPMSTISKVFMKIFGKEIEMVSE